MPDCSGSSTGLEVRPQDQLQSTKDELSKLDRVNMDTVDRRFHNLEYCTHRVTLDLGTLTCQVKAARRVRQGVGAAGAGD
jgi:hypothetical protein